MYTLDTNAIIYYLDDDPTVVPLLDPIFGQDIAIRDLVPNNCAKAFSSLVRHQLLTGGE